MYRIITSITLACLLQLTTVSAATYYLDASSGNDNTGDGTQGAPWQTVEKARTAVASGDIVILAAGTYDGWDDLNKTVPSKTAWVTFRPAAGADVSIARVKTGHWSSDNRRDAYLRFEDLEIDSACATLNADYVEFSNCTLRDGIAISRSAHVTVDSCLLERIGPWVGSVANIEKFALTVSSGLDIIITDCEITNTGGGIACKADSVLIKNTYIHDITHDGIRVTGIQHGLLEGNTICRLDDGVYDSTAANVAKYGADSCASWSRHCDAIHIFISGGVCSTIVRNYDVTVRGNTMYDVDAQHVQFNNYYACSEARNAKILFENNIFGPAAANPVNMADPADTIVFRNNTFVYFPDGRVFSSPFRDIQQDNYTFRISDNYTQVYVYNNILIDSWEGNTEFCDYNLFRTNRHGRAIPRNSIVDTNLGFVDPAALDGRLLASSPAVNAGTALLNPLDMFPGHPTDFYGTPRDTRPDIGAVELAGQDPEPEPQPTPDSGPKYTFIDDFVDSDFESDPWLDTVGIIGLAWTHEETDSGDYELASSSALEAVAVRAPTGTFPCWLYSEQGGNWGAYTLQFDAANAYVTWGDGPMVLAQDKDNHYRVEIGRDHGRIWRVMDGVATVLDSSVDIEMPHSGKRVYEISVDAGSTGVVISVNADRDSTVDLTVTDTDPAAIAKFSAGGGIGLHRWFNENQHLKISYANFRVDVSRFTETSGITPVTAVPMDRLLAVPSVVSGGITTGITPDLRLRMYDAAGTRVAQSIRGASLFSWDAPATGVYYLHATNGRQSAVHRITVIK